MKICLRTDIDLRYLGMGNPSPRIFAPLETMTSGKCCDRNQAEAQQDCPHTFGQHRYQPVLWMLTRTVPGGPVIASVPTAQRGTAQKSRKALRNASPRHIRIEHRARIGHHVSSRVFGV